MVPNGAAPPTVFLTRALLSKGGGHEAPDTPLPNAPVSQATGHSSSMFCCTAALPNQY